MNNYFRIVSLFGIVVFLNGVNVFGGTRFQLIVDEKKIEPHKKILLQNFLEEVEKTIPDKIKSEISRTIWVEFSEIGRNKNLETPVCASDLFQASSTSTEHAEQSHQWFGEQMSTDRIRLNEGFIKEIIAGPQGSRAYNCGHKTLYRLAVATIIHEVAHLYDFSEDHLGSGIISGQEYYQKLAGWRKEWTLSKSFRHVLLAKNHFELRSPDPYEFTSIEEHFAINLEFYLLDSEYSCRRVTLANYFSRHFRSQYTRICKMNTQVNLHSFENHVLTDDRIDLNPNRIFEIHYFPAESGSRLGSQWGHAMFRIITCAPSRLLVDKECLKDLDYHVVVSYRANIQDSVLSVWKTLIGSYPSQVFLYPLNEVVDGYTKKELRDLRSLPLLLSNDEKQQFIFRVLEQYWEYRGEYYFFTNNCNTESIGLLCSVIQHTSMKGFDPVTPLGLQESLVSRNLTNSSVLVNESEAIRNGYLFKSSEKIIEKAFDHLLRFYKETPAVSIMRWDTAWKYVLESTPNDRKVLIAELNQEPSTSLLASESDLEEEILASLYYLESHILLSKRVEFQNKLVFDIEKYFEKIRIQLGTSIVHPLLGLKIPPSFPSAMLKSGYGIALKTDFKEEGLEVDSRTEFFRASFNIWVDQHFSAERLELQLIESNRKKIRKRLSSVFVSKGNCNGKSPI